MANSDPGARTGTASRDERSLAELLKQLSDQSNRLVQQEIELAKAEMALKGKRLGIGAGAFGAAGIIALLAAGAATATAILALAIVLDAWLAALLVTVAYLAVAGVLALVGRSQVEAGTPPVPEQAIESSKEDVRWTKSRARHARE
jgi:hypothetical protein